jgi:hypothetical protein
MTPLNPSALERAAAALANEAAHFDSYVRPFLKNGRAMGQSQAFRKMAEGLHLMALQLESDATDDLLSRKVAGRAP